MNDSREKNFESTGAYARVLIRYDGSFESLLSLLVMALKVCEYELETEQEAPYETFATFEAMGWDGSLTEWTETPHYTFRLFIGTDSLRDQFLDMQDAQSHDLSPWFRDWLKARCSLDVIVSEW